jgi:hypothetical protein
MCEGWHQRTPTVIIGTGCGSGPCPVLPLQEHGAEIIQLHNSGYFPQPFQDFAYVREVCGKRSSCVVVLGRCGDLRQNGGMALGKRGAGVVGHG